MSSAASVACSMHDPVHLFRTHPHPPSLVTEKNLKILCILCFSDERMEGSINDKNKVGI